MRRFVPTVVLLGMLFSVATAPGARAIPAPNDPYYRQQTAPAGALAVLNEPQALLELGATPLHAVLVAALDTGVDLTHPDLFSRLITFTSPVVVPGQWGGTAPAGAHGWNFLGNVAQGDYGTLYSTSGGNADPSDPPGHTGHGTAVTGLMAAGFDNGVGGIGVAPNAQILAIRSCWDDDGCPGFIEPDAIRLAAQLQTRVVTMSWNMNASDFAPSADAIRAAPNTLFVALAGGNGGPTLLPDDQSPCELSRTLANVICVSTSSPSDGLDCGGYSPTIVDLAVPTQNNWTTVNGGSFGPTGCATSYASPTLGGAAAFLFGLDPTAAPAEVKAALMDSARPAAAWSGKSVTGGVLDLAAAVQLFAKRRGITLGQSGPAGPPILKLSLKRHRFRVAVHHRHGPMLAISLSAPAQLTLTISRLRRGTRTRLVETLILKNVPGGMSRRRFSARRPSGLPLPPGRYVLSASATGAAGSRSAAVMLRFTITR